MSDYSRWNTFPVSNEIYGASWNGVERKAPSKNAVYDKLETVTDGLGALASKDSVDLATGEVTNKSLINLDSAANTKLAGIAENADVSPNTASDENLAGYWSFSL